MATSRFILVCSLIAAALAVACSRASASGGPITGTSNTLTVRGEYRPVVLDAVERVSLDAGRLVLHGSSGSVTVDLPPTADPAQTNRGWALVTDGEDGDLRAFTFTHEMSLDDFTIALPISEAPLKYGSFAGRDGHDVLVFAWGAGAQSFWGWVTIAKPPAAQ